MNHTRTTMKLLIALIAIAFIPLPAYSSPEKLPVPSFSKEWNKPENDSHQLKKLLDEGNINQFYYISNQVIDKILQERRTAKSIESLKDHLLVRWLIATTPFIDLSSAENVMWMSDKGSPDSDAKSAIIRRMALETLMNITPAEEKEFNINQSEAIDIYLSTFALILKQFREQIDPDFETKRQQAIEVVKKNRKMIDTNYKMNVYFNRLSMQGGRASSARGIVEEMEQSLMNLLVKAYPNKAAMVKKYLTIAGYAPEEMPSLVDRTIGRIPAAQYLYKNMPKRKN